MCPKPGGPPSADRRSTRRPICGTTDEPTADLRDDRRTDGRPATTNRRPTCDDRQTERRSELTAPTSERVVDSGQIGCCRRVGRSSVGRRASGVGRRASGVAGRRSARRCRHVVPEATAGRGRRQRPSPSHPAIVSSPGRAGVAPSPSARPCRTPATPASPATSSDSLRSPAEVPARTCLRVRGAAGGLQVTGPHRPDLERTR
jgi:hypothetical protein